MKSNDMIKSKMRVFYSLNVNSKVFAEPDPSISTEGVEKIGHQTPLERSLGKSFADTLILSQKNQTKNL